MQFAGILFYGVRSFGVMTFQQGPAQVHQVDLGVGVIGKEGVFGGSNVRRCGRNSVRGLRPGPEGKKGQ